jgi:hypothetical protein
MDLSMLPTNKKDNKISASLKFISGWTRPPIALFKKLIVKLSPIFIWQQAH